MVPHHKMGIKLLTDVQLENIFHNYKSLLNKVEQYRHALEKLNCQELSASIRDDQAYLMYDNVFSIMGKRGAGKTSAVFTLKNKLREEHPVDLVLPIIMPEMIPEGQGMIGWILSILDTEVADLEKKLERNSMDRSIFSNCACEKTNSLSKQLRHVKELYYSQDYNIGKAGNFSSAVANSDMRTQNSFDFGREMTEFWRKLVETIKMVNHMECGQEPLIHIFFDDVDLRPQVLMSLFSTIIKYLSFPNLMVYVTADEDQLYDVIESTMNKRMDKREELVMYGTLVNPLIRTDDNTSRIWDRINTKLDIIDETPKLYSDKILPPSSRYYLETFDNCQRKEFFVYSISETQEPVTLSNWMIKEMDRYIENVLQNKNGEHEAVKNFLIYNNEFINAYLIIFGNTSRQLGNAAIKYSEFIDELIELDLQFKNNQNDRELYFRKLYLTIFDFCSNILGMLAASNEEKYQTRQILRDILTYRAGSWGIYINYIYLRDYTYDKLNEEEKDKDYKNQLYNQMIPIFILMFFIENILMIESKTKSILFGKERAKVHGKGVFIDVLDLFMNGNYSLIWKKQSDTIEDLLWVYGTLIDSPKVLMSFDPVEARKVRAYFRCLPEGLRHTEDDLSVYDRENPKWFRTMTFTLYAAFEGIYNLRKSDILLRGLNEKSSSYWDKTVVRELQNLESDLLDVLSTPPQEESVNEQIDSLIKCNEIDIENTVDYSGKKSIADIMSILQEKAGTNYDMVCARYVTQKQGLPDLIETGHNSSYYLNGMQIAVNKIEELINTFSSFKIRQFSGFLKKIKYLEFELSFPIRNDLIYAVGAVEEEADVVISKAVLRRILQKILEGIIRTRNSYDYSSYFDDEPEDDTDKVYISLFDHISYYLESEDDVKNAVSLLALFQYYKFMQRLYFQSFLYERKKSGTDYRIDIKLIPYEDMYKEIRNHLLESGNLLSDKIKQYVRDGVSNYYNSLK